MSEGIAWAAATVGVAFMFLAGFAMWRLPDFYHRIHALSKASTLGLCSLLFALCLLVRGEALVTKAILVVAFLGATAPVGAHVLARAAYRSRVPWVRMDIDEYEPHARFRERPPDDVG